MYLMQMKESNRGSERANYGEWGRWWRGRLERQGEAGGRARQNRKPILIGNFLDHLQNTLNILSSSLLSTENKHFPFFSLRLDISLF